MSDWYIDGCLDGRQWTLVRGSHVRTPDVDVPLPLSMVDGNKQPVPPPGIPQNLLYLRVSHDGSKFAGVGNLDDKCWEREGGAWLDRGIAYGPQSVVYDNDGVLHIVPPPEAFGYRYVKPNNQLVTCTDSHFDAALKIWDYTKLGDVFIGQGGDGPHGDDPCIAIESDGTRRLISEGRCRFINAYREGDAFAIYCVREDTLEAKQFLLTRQQIAELPKIDAEPPPPDEWPITQRTEPEIFYPFHTCSGRASEAALSPDGTGWLPTYPQNVIGVGDSGAVALATRSSLPIMLGGLSWPTDSGRQFGEDVKAAGLQHRVKTLWCAAADDNPVGGPRGAPTAERVAQAERARWNELFAPLPAPPVMYYVGPQEVEAGDWFRPPSIDVYMPEFYFTPGIQSATQVEREIWEKAELYIDRLGWEKPWIPVWRCYRRDWNLPTDMPLMAAMQTRFFEAAREIEAELQKRMPAGERRRVIYGNGFFAVLRKEGAIEYPKAMDAHRRMFAAIPAGSLPDLSGGNGGGGGDVDIVIRLGPYARTISRSAPYGLDVPWDVDSDRPIARRRFQMLDGDPALGRPHSAAIESTYTIAQGTDGRYERGVRFKPTINGAHRFELTLWDDQDHGVSVTSEPITVTSDVVDPIDDGPPGSLQAAVQAELAKYQNASHPDRPSREDIGKLLNAVAWSHRGKGWGLSVKPNGNHVPAPQGVDVAYDILHHRSSNKLFGCFTAQTDSSPLIVNWGEEIYHGDPVNRPWLAPIQPV